MIRFGLLGCGRIAKRHSDLLGGNHIEGARLVAVCDPIRARADAISGKFSVPAIYDINDFLARKDIDAVSVLTPSGLHPQHVIACARAGKHVVVEKPMALRLQDADDMIRACDEAGVKLFIVKQNRFNVPVVKGARRSMPADSESSFSARCACAGAATRPITTRTPGAAIPHFWSIFGFAARRRGAAAACGSPASARRDRSRSRCWSGAGDACFWQEGRGAPPTC
jgi:hypothetical protein